MYYVCVSIGCLECGEISSVLGVFTDQDAALVAARRGEEQLSSADAHQHKIFPVKDLDTHYNPGIESTDK